MTDEQARQDLAHVRRMIEANADRVARDHGAQEKTMTEEATPAVRRCRVCGRPENAHPYRHPFRPEEIVRPTVEDVPSSRPDSLEGLTPLEFLAARQARIVFMLDDRLEVDVLNPERRIVHRFTSDPATKRPPAGAIDHAIRAAALDLERMEREQERAR